MSVPRASLIPVLRMTRRLPNLPEYEKDGVSFLDPSTNRAPAAHWLAIAEEAFVPTNAGGRVESLNMLRAVSAAGIRLHVIVPGVTASEAEAHRAQLPDAWVEAIPRRTGWLSNVSLSPYLFKSRPLSLGLTDRMRTLHQRDPFDAVLGVSFRVAHLGKELASALRVPLVIRPHNVESQYFCELARSSTFPRNVPYLLEAAKLRRAEKFIHASTDVALYADIGERDAEWRGHQTRTPVICMPPFLLPGSLNKTGDRTERPDSQTLLFIGALDNSNNVAGVDWFLEGCWVRLHQMLPDADFHVVGRRAPDALVALWRAEGVRVTVDAPEIAPHLAAANVFVNPVRQGAGVNIKMIEAMSAGVPVVSSAVGARGMRWRSGEHLIIANSPEDFTDAVRRLLTDAAERGRLGAAGRQFLREELDGVRQIETMRSMLESSSLRPRW